MSIEQWNQSNEVALASQQDVAVQRLADWAQSADAAYQVAERLSTSAFVPAQFKGKPVELTAAILSGLEVGLSPMAAMRSFDIIQGQAAPRAITLRAVVQSHGHEMVLIESTNSRCRMKGRRRGSDEWQSVMWTIERAQQLALTGKDNWKKQPGAMLLARATSELARLIASDAILGIGYSAEEVADGGSLDQQIGEQTTTPSAATGTRKMSRRPVEQATPNPSPAQADTEPDANQAASPDADQVSAGEDSITSSQTKKMAAAMRELGITARDDALLYVNDVIRRDIDVTSRNELTKDEASAVIEALEGDRVAGQNAGADS